MANKVINIEQYRKKKEKIDKKKRYEYETIYTYDKKEKDLELY